MQIYCFLSQSHYIMKRSYGISNKNVVFNWKKNGEQRKINILKETWVFACKNYVKST